MYQQSIRIGGPVTPAVKTLLIINVVIFSLQLIAHAFASVPNVMEYLFSLSYTGVYVNYWFWQPFTYMFLHYDILHILFNMLALWMFAGYLEQRWGTGKFVRYYLLSGLIAGLFISALDYFMFARYGTVSATTGASGALFAILLAYGLTWPEQEILVFFILPVKMKFFVIIFGVVTFLLTLSSLQGTAGGGMSHIGHLGGLIGGFVIYQIMFERIRIPFINAFLSRKKKPKIRFKVVDNSEKAKVIIDKMLDKIAKDGIEALTPEERKQLEWARKNYYPGGNETVH